MNFQSYIAKLSPSWQVMLNWASLKPDYYQLTGSATRSRESSEIVDFKGVHYLDSPMLISKMILESQDRRPLFIYCQAQFQLASEVELG